MTIVLLLLSGEILNSGERLKPDSRVRTTSPSLILLTSPGLHLVSLSLSPLDRGSELCLLFHPSGISDFSLSYAVYPRVVVEVVTFQVVWTAVGRLVFQPRNVQG